MFYMGDREMFTMSVYQIMALEWYHYWVDLCYYLKGYITDEPGCACDKDSRKQWTALSCEVQKSLDNLIHISILKHFYFPWLSR